MRADSYDGGPWRSFPPSLNPQCFVVIKKQEGAEEEVNHN